MYFRCFVVVVLISFGTQCVDAGEKERTHTITLDDYFTQADILDLATSPDGKHVAYVLTSWSEATNDRKSDLWIASTQDANVRKLTFDRANDRAPQWSADGQYIYFLGNRKRGDEKNPPYNGSTQVWRIHVGGGNPFAVTREPSGVSQFALAPDGKSVYLLKSREQIDGPFAELRRKFKHVHYGHGIIQASQIWKLDLETWRTEKLYDGGRVIKDFAVAPDGKRIAMITAPDDTVVSFEGKSRVDIFDIPSRTLTTMPDQLFRKKVPSPYGWLEHLAWSADSKKLAFNVIFDAYPSEVVIASLENKEPTVFFVPRPDGLSLQGYGSPIAWKSADEICWLADWKARVKLMSSKITPGSTETMHTELSPVDTVVADFSFSADGKSLVVAMNDHKSFVDLHSIDRPGKGRKLTNVNPQTATWKLPQVRTVRWEGAGGVPVEGVLELPPDYKPGTRLPLVLVIHDGPSTCTHYKLQYWIYGRTLLASQGYAVLCPNYRGSTGYGDKFLTDLVGKENNLDVTDILKGVDAVIEMGIADPDRLAVTGWSNGGYLTNCIISQTNRFKAAISGAGIVDAVMEFGANDEPAYVIVFKQGFPWNASKQYHDASPTYALDKIRTPTLIHVGENDERCPPGQSRLLYRALKEYLNVPTELLVYPGEGHGLTTYANRRAKMEWDLAWLERYVLGKNSTK